MRSLKARKIVSTEALWLGESRPHGQSGRRIWIGRFAGSSLREESTYPAKENRHTGRAAEGQSAGGHSGKIAGWKRCWLWLAEVGKERIDEIIDPELTIDRALETYLKKGYTREWINQRLQAIQVRKELTDAWDDHGIQKGVEYAILTDEITKAWSGMTTRGYKNLKGLKKENLRDNMTTLEIVLNMLAEATTTELTKTTNPKGLEENKKVAKEGGRVAGNARKEIEQKTGKPVITSKNAVDLSRLIEDAVKEPFNKKQDKKDDTDNET